jgi:hypothetical protein
LPDRSQESEIWLKQSLIRGNKHLFLANVCRLLG